jgi:periplasmic divalent cation tolerance protein
MYPNKQLILITCCKSSRQEAKKISKIIIKSKLSICFHIVKINSYFIWEKEIVKTKEFEIQIKTNLDKFKEIEIKIKNNHSYKLPGISYVTIDGGSEKYLKWLSCNQKNI